MRKALLLSVALFLSSVSYVAAQENSDPATLIADKVQFDGSGRLVARGNVQVFYRGRTLTATQVIYHEATDTLEISGPITVMEPDGTIIRGESADISADFTEGIVESARVILDEKLQIASAQVIRSENGRYTEMLRSVASSCSICEENEVPLWQIRANRVIHDTETRDITFEHAQFRVMGVPVAYAPRLTLPDPNVTRRTGFLSPSFIADSELGFGVKTPYFITLGDSRDLTITPYITGSGAWSLEGRYRQVFKNGQIEFEGAISRDDDAFPGRYFSYIDGSGRFQLPQDYNLAFNLELSSTDEYLERFSYSTDDRLVSSIFIDRTDRTTLREARVYAIQSLREQDNNAEIPTLITNLGQTTRFQPKGLGGQGSWSVELQGLARENDSNTGSTLTTNNARDVTRISAGIDWSRTWVHGSGIVTKTSAALYADTYYIHQDPTAFPTNRASRVVPYFATEASLPLQKRTGTGVVHTLTPRIQAVFAPDDASTVPNEDALFAEFDEASLFSFSRFTGDDVRELGNRLNVGVEYTRLAPGGSQVGLSIGRVIRQKDLGQFSASSGLDGKVSNWLISSYYTNPIGFSARGRALVDDNLTVSRAELQGAWARNGHNISGTLIWLKADDAIGRPTATRELNINTKFQLTPDWSSNFNWRYDLETNTSSGDADFGLLYRTDCVDLIFNVNRRFNSTSTLPAATTYSLQVALHGFGADTRPNRKGKKACLG